MDIPHTKSQREYLWVRSLDELRNVLNYLDH